MTSTTETTDKPARILIEDNEEATREIMTSILTAAGYECGVAATPAETLKVLKSGAKVDLVLCEIADWAEEDFKCMIWTTTPDIIPVLVSTGVVGLMSKVLQMGAYDFLIKPFQREQLIFAVRRALQHRRLKLENFFLRDRLGLGSGIDIPLSLLGRRIRAGDP